MKQKKRKLDLKKLTILKLNKAEKMVAFGGSRINCSATACLGTFGCCQPTK